MKAIVLNGSLSGQNDLDPSQRILMDELRDAGLKVEAISLNQLNIKPCIGCFRCWHTTPGICSGVKGDDAEEVIRKVINCQLLVFLTPLTYGGYSSEIKKIYGRFLGLLQPGMQIIDREIHHLKRYKKYPSHLAIGMTTKLDENEVNLFKTLVDRNSKNFYPPKHHAGALVYSDENLRGKIREMVREVVQ
jgi:multimeric flavodoxin WrbA